MTHQTHHSPRLKEVMAEIKAVLKRNDIAAHVVLHEPGFSEYNLAIEPSWSALRYERDAEGRLGLRARARPADYESPEAQRAAVANTLNLCVHMAKVLGEHAELFAQLQAGIEACVKAEHTECVHTPHEEH